MVRSRYINVGWLVFICLFAPFWLTGQTQAAITVDAQVSPSQVGVGEPFEYQVTVSGAGRGVAQPVLAQMPGVEVVGSGTSSMFRSVNGQISRSKVFSYTLVAEAPGDIDIPPATVTIKGTEYRTRALRVTILAVSNRSRAQGSGGRNAFGSRSPYDGLSEGDVTIDTAVDVTTPYVGQQVILTFSFDRAVELSQVSYTPAETSGFRSFDLSFPRGGDKHDYHKDGRRRIVQERKVALFPVHPGEASIGSASIDISVTPFSGGQRLMTRPITLAVKPLPVAGRPDDFSGLVGEADIAASLSAKTAQVGDALTLTVTVSGRGNLHDLSAPKITGSADFDVYDPEVSEAISHGLNGVAGSVSFSYVLIPRLAGDLTVPALSLSVFDPKAGVYRRVSSGALAVSVVAAVRAAPAASSMPQVADVASDPVVDTPPERSLGQNMFGWLQGLALLVVLLLIRRWYRRRQRPVGDTLVPSAPVQKPLPPLNVAEVFSALDAALAEADDSHFLKAFERVVKGYMAGRLGVSTAQVERDVLVQRLGADEALCRDAQALLSALNLARFAPGAAALDRHTLADHARRVVTALAETDQVAVP